jgi:hypothetical protein
MICIDDLVSIIDEKKSDILAAAATFGIDPKMMERGGAVRLALYFTLKKLNLPKPDFTAAVSTADGGSQNLTDVLQIVDNRFVVTPSQRVFDLQTSEEVTGINVEPVVSVAINMRPTIKEIDRCLQKVD